MAQDRRRRAASDLFLETPVFACSGRRLPDGCIRFFPAQPPSAALKIRGRERSTQLGRVNAMRGLVHALALPLRVTGRPLLLPIFIAFARVCRRRPEIRTTLLRRHRGRTVAPARRLFHEGRPVLVTGRKIARSRRLPRMRRRVLVVKEERSVSGSREKSWTC